MRVLVTGAIGFVAINVVRYLAEQGDNVIGLYRTPPDATALRFLAGVHNRVTLVRGDVGQPAQLAEAMTEHRVDAVVHAAAITPLPQTERTIPGQVLGTNFMGTVHVLDAARQAGIRRVIFVSSDGMYGAATDLSQPVSEDTIPSAPGLYAVAKIASEAVCRRYATLFGMEIASGRVCATYGPMERPTASRQGMSAVYEFAQAALAGRPLRVHGLGVTRPWTHVEDIALALIALLKASAHPSPAYNLSYGCPYTLRDVLETTRQLVPGFAYTEVGAEEPADLSFDERQQRATPDITRLRQEIGYHPHYGLAAGLAAYLDWLRLQGPALR